MILRTDNRTTQIYGKIVQKKVSTDMRKLKSKGAAHVFLMPLEYK